MDENQHILFKMTQTFDASPAVTTEMRQDPYFVPSRGRNGQVGGMGRQPLNPPRHKSLVYATAGVSSGLCKQTLSPQIHVNMHLNHIVMMIIMRKVTLGDFFIAGTQARFCNL